MKITLKTYKGKAIMPQVRLEDFNDILDFIDEGLNLSIEIRDKPIVGLDLCLELKVNGITILCFRNIADIHLITPKGARNFQKDLPLDTEKEP